VTFGCWKDGPNRFQCCGRQVVTAWGDDGNACGSAAVLLNTGKILVAGGAF
jgi:hypothetical protein